MKREPMTLFKKFRLRRLANESTLFAVLWWPQADYHVPELRGPFIDSDTALQVRNSIRSRQCREEQMAQVVPFTD